MTMKDAVRRAFDAWAQNHALIRFVELEENCVRQPEQRLISTYWYIRQKGAWCCDADEFGYTRGEHRHIVKQAAHGELPAIFKVGTHKAITLRRLRLELKLHILVPPRARRPWPNNSFEPQQRGVAPQPAGAQCSTGLQVLPA